MEGLTLKRSWRHPVSKNMGRIWDAPHVHTWAGAPTHMAAHTQLYSTVEKETKKKCLETLSAYVVIKEKSNIIDFVDNCGFKKRCLYYTKSNAGFLKADCNVGCENPRKGVTFLCLNLHCNKWPVLNFSWTFPHGILVLNHTNLPNVVTFHSTV